MLHGTHSDKIGMITQYGFDQRMARESGLYGQGVYFTDQSCKSACGILWFKLGESGSGWLLTSCGIEN